MKSIKNTLCCLMFAAFCLCSVHGNAVDSGDMEEFYRNYYTTSWGQPEEKSPWKDAAEMIPSRLYKVNPVALETLVFCTFGMISTYGMILHPAEGLAAIGTFYGIPKVISIWRDMRLRLKAWMQPMYRKS